MVTQAQIHAIGSVLNDNKRPLKERFRALFTLKNIGGADVIAEISRGFDDDSALLKHELAYCLGQMQDSQAIDVLNKVLSDVKQEPMVRHEAATLNGTVPHYFYKTVERLFADDMKFRRVFQFLSERLVFAPFYQALSLYFLSRFEWNSHDVAVANLQKLYWPLLKANWRYLSIAVFLNMTYVPPMLRTVTMSIVSFIWVVYVARSRRRLQEKQARGTKSSSGTSASTS